MCTACTVSFDQGVANAFGERMIGHLNGAAIMLMASVGHRTGLFDAMGDGEHYSSQRLAEKTTLSERYVREWLGAMTTGGITRYDPRTQQYHLPAEHAAFLTRAGAPNNVAATAQFVAVLGAAEDAVVEAFRHGRGVPYSQYAHFHEVMAEESSQTTLLGLEEHILPLVDGLVSQLEKGIDVADVGCGRGLAMIHLARRFPRSTFVGLDLSEEAIRFARETARREGLANIRFEQRDLTQGQIETKFDLITAFDAIHDQARPDHVLKSIANALKPAGVFLMQDIKASSHVERNYDLPLAPWIYTISCMHCMSVSLAQGGVGLGAAWGEEKARQLLREAGLASIEVKTLPHDILNLYFVCRK